MIEIYSRVLRERVMGRMPDKTEDFQKFYFDKVATGEGCGCAERIIDNHEFNRLAGTSRLVTGWIPRKGAWRRFLLKAGIYSRD